MIKVKDIVVLAEAVEDLKSGQTFYDSIESGLGDLFWDSLINDLEFLINIAGIHYRVFDVYRMLARKFPFAIYYKTEDNVVQIIAILPIKQNPENINRRLKKFNNS